MKMKDKYVVVLISPFHKTDINTFNKYEDAVEFWDGNWEIPCYAAGTMLHYKPNGFYETLKQFADRLYFNWEKED